jgi:cell division protein FtsW
MAIGAVAAAGIYLVVFTDALSYANDRLSGWLNPLTYVNNEQWQDTWQTRNSLYAIGSGGWLGLGLGNSRQKYMYLPEPQNDFVFAIVCEELGFIGALIIMILFALLVWRGITLSIHAEDRFGAVLGIGLVMQVGIQTALNIAVVTNTIPNTGISLPFFSYGGTSLVMLLMQMGVVLSISRTSNIEKT